MIRSEYKLYEEADIAVDRYQHNGNHKTVLGMFRTRFV